MTTRPSRWVPAALLLGAGTLGGGCVPDVAKDPIPESMQFDPTVPRVPAPTGLVVNRTTGHIDFSLAGPPVPADCSMPAPYSQAECEFDTYLQSLDGFPTVTPATAPATAALDLTTVTPGTNVVIVAAGSTPSTVVTDVTAGFDSIGKQLTLHPSPHWKIGEVYWLGVRGYTDGVRAVGGREVVGSPVQALLKQETSLTCGASDAASVDPACPAVALLAQSAEAAGASAADAVQGASAQAVQLEAIRLSLIADGAWDAIEAHGLPKAETAVLWGFPVHTASVAEVDPTAGLVPRVTSPTQIRIAVQGTVDPATVVAFSVGGPASTLMLLDLTELAMGGTHIPMGFPHVTASYSGGDIVVDADAPFVAGHTLGIFMRKEMTDAAGKPLVPSPISVLLRLHGALVDAQGHSQISTVADGDAQQLEAGRAMLAALFDDQSLAFVTGGFLKREDLTYAYAFPYEGAP